MLKAKDYEDGTPNERIEVAKEGGLITGEMETWAHQVRLDASDQRHADGGAGLPTTVDADSTIRFARAFGEYLFVLPSKVNRGIEETPSS
ncbi:MAG: hypothetical protein LJF04_15255 [Gemmatimonadetes bacterium]|nr:hypothetical protein [Gemmatimonadota bacterium]